MSIFETASARFNEAAILAFSNPEVNPIVIEDSSEVLRLKKADDEKLDVVLFRPHLGTDVSMDMCRVAIDEKVARVVDRTTRLIDSDIVARIIVGVRDGIDFEALDEGTEDEYHRVLGPGDRRDITSIIRTARIV